MATLEYFIVCAMTSVDAETGAISLFQVLEDFFPDEFPDILPRAEAVCLWNLDPGDERTDFQATLKITLPGEDVAISFPMNLSRGWKRYRAILAVADIPLKQPGLLKFEVLLNGQHCATHIIDIHEEGALKFWAENKTVLPT